MERRPDPERHPDEDELIALALDTLPGEPADLLRHLAGCPACRSTYDDISASVDAVLPAAPAAAAPPGFDARVLDRLELRVPSAQGAGPHPSGARRSYRIRLLVAAAAAAGICLGAAGAVLLDHESAPVQVATSDHGALLVTRSGATVGIVEPSRYGDDRVMVMQITDGRPGAHYTCRFLLKDGSTRAAGQWWMPSSGQATWIAYGAADTVDRVELVTDDGRVWSSAELDG